MLTHQMDILDVLEIEGVREVIRRTKEQSVGSFSGVEGLKDSLFPYVDDHDIRLIVR